MCIRDRSGIYSHRVLDRKVPLVRSLNDTFLAPHSRYTEVRREDIRKHPELMILAESDEAGVFLVMSRDGRQIFVQGHPEYDRMTLNNEYHRDLKKGLDQMCIRDSLCRIRISIGVGSCVGKSASVYRSLDDIGACLLYTSHLW